MISIQFTKLVDCLNELEKTTKKLEKIEILKEFLKTVDANEVSSICRLITAKLFLPWEGEFLGVAEKMVIKVISKAMNVKIPAIIDQQRKTGDLGVTIELFAQKKIKTGTLLEALGVQLQSLTVKKVFNSLQNIARITGEGSVNRKQDIIVNLLAVASPIEAKFIVRIVLGDLRIGVAELSLLDALGETYLTSKEEKKLLDHKFNIHPDIGHIAYLLSKEGKKGLDKISIGTGIPIRTMAAQRLSKPEEILEKLGDSCAIEWKYDGERVQAHVDPNKISLFSCLLNKYLLFYYK
ncbi:MAG: hypothetical protein ACFFCQ_17415 [Promethearchaeota archaeon]